MNRTMKPLMKIAAHILLAMLLPLASFAQVSVSLAPVPHMQFLNNAGVPLASGCVFTYQGGTTIPAATYVDSTGTTQNSNPIILDAGGFANIWLPNAAFKFKVVSAGGVNCASGVTQWTVDNISGVLGLLNLANTFTAANTFQQPITITPNSNQLVLGAGGNQTTLNSPAPAGNITINLPSIAGTLIESASPAITNPTIGGISMPVPATFISLLNSGAGTTINTLTKLVPTGANMSGVISAAGDLGGVVGICIASCGAAGSATIQQGGIAACVFDGPPAVFADDYVTISATTAGDCHDAGATYPTGGTQVIGRITVTTGVNPINVMLFGPEIRQNGVVASINLSAQAANIVSTPLFTPAANGLYRFNCYTVVTQAATTSSTLPNCQVIWTDAETSISNTVNVTTTNTVNTVGAVGVGPANSSMIINAKSGVAISYATASYASVGATPMQYAIHFRLEGPL